MKYKIEHKKDDLINGVKFVKDIEPYVKGNRKYRKCIFKCKCGNEFETLYQSVKYGSTQSCGCYNKQRVKETMTGHKHNFKHGHSSSINQKINYIYVLWIGIKGRCLSENNKDYKHYGGRGITMYSKWINNYPAFNKYILDNLGDKPKPHKLYSIDRINNNGNYEPNNLRWATVSTQNKNRRNY